MTAILGCWRMDGAPLHDSDFRAALNCLSGQPHILIHRSVGFACANQPLYLHDPLQQPVICENLMIAADARIDNHVELLRPLDLPPLSDDAALIARAYARWGRACVDHLIGDYAFAIYDVAQRRLFCARDHAGVRPFYYYHARGFFAFASSIRALVALPDVPQVIDEGEVAAFMNDFTDPAIHTTFYRDVRKLPSGCCLTVDPSGLNERRYWQPMRHDTHVHLNLAQAAEGLRAVIMEAVDCRLQTDLPVGTHISGGLDSSTLTMIAAQRLRERGRELTAAYSWSPAISEQHPLMEKKDERRIIELVARAAQVPVRYSEKTVDDLTTFLQRDISQANGILRDAEAVVLRNAQANGVRVMLSGWGGDEAATFNARGYLSWLFITGQWRPLWEILLARGWNSRKRALREFVVNVLPALIPRGLHDTLRWITIRRLPPSLIRREVLARTRDRRAPRPTPRERIGVFETQAALFNYGHLSQRMEDWTVWGAEHNITYTYPLLDRRVLDYVYGLSPHVFYSGRWHRYVFRQAMVGILPVDVVWSHIKYDTAYERREEQLWLAWWRTAERFSDWDKAAAWLDAARVRAALRRVPADLSHVADLVQCLRLMNAFQVKALHDRNVNTSL